MPSAAASESRLDSTPVSGTSIDRNRNDQGEEAEADDDEQEPRQGVGEHLGEVDGHGLEATDVGLSPPSPAVACGMTVSAQVEQQVGGRHVLRRRRREDLDDADRRRPSATGAGGGEGHARIRRSARRPGLSTAAWSPAVGSSHGDVERAVDARPEALGGEVVGDPGGLPGAVPQSSEKPSRSDSMGIAMMSMTTSANTAGHPRPLLQPVAVAGERARGGAGPEPCRRCTSAPVEPAHDRHGKHQDPAEVAHDPARPGGRRR